MRSIAIGLFVPLVAGSCLPDAIPSERRQNLVNSNGETYPVGVLIADWPASYAAQYLGAVLIQEVLGYHTTFNLDDVVGSSVDGYYGIAGCRTPGNIEDRGCMQGATYYHVSFESWAGFPGDWNFIQETYPSIAPINKGTMGYPGLSTTYIPKPVQQQAYSTQGVALEYYRNWNVSWNQPWNFFDGISSIDKQNLMPCNASVMSDDPSMRRHALITGDTDGVVVVDDKYSGRCDDAYWWLPPACRANPSTCIPWVTGGTGWRCEEFMQKFTTFSMPVAIGVAGNWDSYTMLPLAGNMPFYWWQPDPSFLGLAPLTVQFPTFNPREFSAGILTSQGSTISVNAIVSRDLAVLAPSVESFADNLELSLAQMNDILLDQKNTGDSWEDVTCRWVKANRATWQKWIPDESACFPGFGLYDAVVKDFVEQRENATNKITCQACPPGTFSQIIEDSQGETFVCVPCGLGTSQPSGAALSCVPCKTGEYQDGNGSTECKRCAFGTYQDEEGQVACKSCPRSTNTLGFGSIAPSDCGCLENQIDMDSSGGFECVACMEGMRCPALSQLVDLQNGTSANGESFIPKIMAGFFCTKDSPTEVFKCSSIRTCPGGTPGTCGGGLIGTPCSQCEAGATWTGSACEDCGGWRQAVWGLALCGVFGFLTLAYYLTTSKVTAKATVLFATTASFGMLVMSMQNLGLVGTMTVEWPEGLQALFSVCQFLLLDIDSYGFSCIAGQSEPIRYLLSVLIFPVGCAWMALCYGVSRFLPEKHHWEGPKVCSAIGAFLQVGFSTMSATSLAPMMCYKHPNGLRSILKYPGVICGSTDHTTMLVFAWFLLVVFVFGFVSVCAFAAWKVPSWSAKRHDGLVASVRFLVFRFRLDAWWFGVPLLVRGPLINLPVVLATDSPPIQVVVIAMLLTTMMVMQMLAWPWKVPLLNVTDSIVSFCIVLVVTTSSLYLNKIDSAMYGFANGVTAAMLSGIGVAIGVMIVMTASAVFHRSAMGGKQELWMFNLGKVPSSEELAVKTKEMAIELEKSDAGDLTSKLAALSVFDTNKITTCVTLLATEVAPPLKDAGSFKFNKRIAGASFDPALKMKPQSRSAQKVEAKLHSENHEVIVITVDAIENKDEVTNTKWI